ncbi:Alcohol-forming fatty acyl-CoA reductase [Arachis hypogaea]|nr:Alcohol-forming fatty acyl-CoA reductase [Arachis hypogaea]
MELGSIIEFLEGKTIFVTGATGFLAKIFVEKILRVQPNVKKLYLLVRAEDIESATQRMHDEIIGKDLFRLLKKNLGPKFNSFLSEKLAAIPGDISQENLNLKNFISKEEIYNQLDVIINVAGATKFDERYDVALGTNTLGVKHILDFAKRCIKLKVLVHLSTDIDMERKVIEDSLNQLQEKEATKEEIKVAMKDLGIKRANKYGWPNTYVFTKAMGEMLLWHMKGDMPLSIIRPTMITSTYKEPFPGWIEGARTIDGITVAYGKGKLRFFLASPEGVIDMIPADLVVNAMIVVLVAHANQPKHIIYHVGSSISNPIKYRSLPDYGYRYFKAKPWIDLHGKPVKVCKGIMLDSMVSFRRFMFLRYQLPLKVVELVNAVLCQYFRGLCDDLNKKIHLVMRLAELYKPYVFLDAVFDNMNTMKLLSAAREGDVEMDLFNFDPKIIDWEDYFLNVHLPGIAKYVMK